MNLAPLSLTPYRDAMIAKLWRVLRRRGAAGPKTVILHVGAGKTGTSAIQTWLARNLRRLEKHGIAYPEPPEGFDLAVEGKITTGNATPIVEYVVQRRRPRSFDEAAFFAWLDGVLRRPADTVLFSSETLPGGDRKRFAALKAHLEERGCRVEIIYAVRNAADHVFSRWGQMVKRHGSTLTWDQFCRDGTVPFLRVLDSFSGIFGPDAVHVINYERHKHDIVRRMMSIVTPADLGDTRVGRVNRSLSMREMELMRVFNTELSRHKPPAVVSNRLATDLSDHFIYAADLPPMRLALTAEQFARLNETLGETVETLNRRYLPDEPILVADPKVVTGAIPPVALGEVETRLMRELAACAVRGDVFIHMLAAEGDCLQALSRAVQAALADSGAEPARRAG